jgi:hypothetical protein
MSATPITGARPTDRRQRGCPTLVQNCYSRENRSRASRCVLLYSDLVIRLPREPGIAPPDHRPRQPHPDWPGCPLAGERAPTGNPVTDPDLANLRLSKMAVHLTNPLADRE